MTLTHFTVTGNWTGFANGSTIGADVDFKSNVSGVASATGETPPLGVVEEVVSARIMGGVLHDLNGSNVRLKCNQAALNLAGALQYRVSFRNVEINGRRQGSIPDFTFAARSTDTVLNLITEAPAPALAVAALASLPVSGLSDATLFMKGVLATATDQASARTAIGISGSGAEWESYVNLAAFPVTGNVALEYVAQDTGKLYRWNSGTSAYVQIADKASVGLGNADNTSDANKPVSTAQQTALDGKQRTIVIDARDNAYGITFNGTTDDTTAWGTLATSLVAGDTVVLPPKKTSIISAYVNLSAADINIIGNGCTLKLAAGTAAGTTVMYLQGARSSVQGVHFDGSQVAGSTGLRPTGNQCTVAFNDFKDCIAGGVYFQGASYGTKVTENNFRGQGYGVCCDSASTFHHVTISNNSFDGGTSGDAIDINTPDPNPGASDITITGNVVRNYTMSGGFHGIGIGIANVHRCTIANNIVSGVNLDGIHVEDGSTDFTISGNTVYGCGRSGINVVNTGAAIPTRFVIANNTVTNCLLTAGAAGIAIEGTSPIKGGSIADNIVRGCGRAGATVYGIYLGTNSSHLRVIGNGVSNTTGSATFGIGLVSLTNSTVIGNHCYDDQATKTQQYGMLVGGIVTDVSLLANDLYGNLTGPIEESTLSTASFDYTKRYNRPNTVDSPQEFVPYAGAVTTDAQHRTAFGNAFPGVGFSYWDSTNNRLVVRAGTNTYDALTPDSVAAVILNKDLTSGTNTFPTFNQPTTGSAAKWTTARNLAGNSVDGSANVAFANALIAQGTADAGLTGAQFLGALSTGLVKNTTTTGVLSIAVDGTDYLSLSDVPRDLSSGEAVMDRMFANSTVNMSTGVMRCAFFTARKTETITQVRTISGTGASGGTICRIGIYTVDASDNLTALVASTTNDTTLWVTTGTVYTKSLTASFSKVRGQRYAVCALSVGSGTPTLVGNAAASGVELAIVPRRNAALPSQTDLPTGGSPTVAVGSFTSPNGSSVPYIALVP